MTADRPVPPALCALCHRGCDRTRWLADVGPRFLHEACEARMAAMGYTITAERRTVERRTADRRAA